MENLDDFLKTISQGKKVAIQNSPGKKALKELQESIRQSNPFVDHSKEVEPQPEPVLIKEEFVQEIVAQPAPQPVSDPLENVVKYLHQEALSGFQQPNPEKVDPNFKAIQDKLKFLEQWLGKITAHGPGSGEVNLRWLDDVDRPSIYDMRYMRYNDAKKKFEFAEVNPHDIVYTTHLVTTPTYTIDDDDYYVGVDYDGPVTITLPETPSSGRMLIIKDESGDAETNPITVSGNVDNDPTGFIIQINNGAVQLIYRNGWRIV